MKHLLTLLLIPSLALAEPTTTEQCQQLLDAYGQIEVKAGQAQLVAQVQKGVFSVCQKLVAAEREKEAKPEEPKEK